MCLFVGSEFLESDHSLCALSYTFTGFHRWTHMYNKKYRGFHPKGYLSLLSISRHIFSFSCIQPCDPVGRCPTVPSPPDQTPNVVLIITMHSHPFHAMCHFMPIRCHIYDELYMDDSTHSYHPCIMDNYINRHKISKRSHISCQYICTHISTSTSHHQSSNGILYPLRKIVT